MRHIPSTHTDLSIYSYDEYDIVHVRAGYKGVRRIVPPAGEDYAFDVTEWRHRVEVTVSPTGRSVRVHVDGKQVWP